VIVWIELFAMSIAALPAVIMLAFGQRDEEGEGSDGSLHAQFVVIFGLTALLMYGLLQQPTIRRSVDPQARLEAHPVMTALREYKQDRGDTILEAARVQVARGHSVEEAVRTVHPELFRVANSKLGWVDAQTMLDWMDVYTDQLKHLAERNVEQCAALAMLQADGIAALAGGLEPALANRLEARFVEVLASARIGLAKMHPRVEAMDSKAFAELYESEVHRPLTQRYDEPLARHLRSTRVFRAPDGRFRRAEPPGDPATICNASLEQMRLIRQQQPAEAARMFKSVRSWW
jgi:hypothetical protein